MKKTLKIFSLFILLFFSFGRYSCKDENKPTPNPDQNTPAPQPEPKPTPKVVEYSVKFFDGNTLLAEQKVKKGETIATLPQNPVKTGHTFAGWYSNSAFTQELDSSQKITGDTNVYAKFVPIKYTVTFHDDVNLVATKQVEYNKTAELPKAPEKDGYNFVGWFKDSALTMPFDPTTKITADTKVYAKYLNNLDYFMQARTNTVEGDTFKYTYKLAFENVFENKIKNIPLPGAFYNGTVYYNKINPLSYLRDEITSGALIKDHHNYHFIKDGNLHKVTFKHNKKTNADTDPKEEIKNNYKEAYEYSLYAKALFKYAKDKFAKVTKTGTVYELTFTEKQIDLIKEFLISKGQNKIADKLKTENIRSIKVEAQIDPSTNKITKFSYKFEFQQEYEQKILGKTVKGTLVSKLTYELTFDNQFNGQIPVDSQIKNFVK